MRSGLYGGCGNISTFSAVKHPVRNKQYGLGIALVSNADFLFHFDNWPRLEGARKYTSVRSRDTQEHETVHAIYQ
ncbi:hypothetical protein TNCV_4938111 [Trichonephila clavipes]|nr:hypothetical protein TNCV_4938111 [Trichonephila clavipes]